MDFDDQEIISFFKALNLKGVRYILVGGLAVNYHGFSRSTGDIDLWLDDAKPNRVNFVEALKEYGITGSETFLHTPFVAGYTEIGFDNGISIDLMSDLQFFKKENFDECYADSVIFNLSENVPIRIIHLNTLIAEKEKSARPKDNLDAQTLKKLYNLS